VLDFTVNGERQQLAVPDHMVLMDLLRDQLKLLSVREGCGIGVCGACTVLVDGKPVSACLMLAGLADGRNILTVEGLGAPGALHPIQEAFIAEAGFQCSYCTPGILLTAKALLDENPDPSDDEIRDYLMGNLCRCGSYVKILASVRRAASELGGERHGDPRSA
jgi:aerobic carbon-monoxide dehydrogenase small subunit